VIVAEPVLITMAVAPIELPDAFSARFNNWVRWCVQKGLYRGRAGSVEGAYRSPQHWDPPEPRPPTIDVLDAILVNRAYVRLAMLSPRNAKVIQVLVFHPYIRPTRQAQILGTHYLELDRRLDEAKAMLANQLRAS
jgi:hypothetical protein